MQRSLLNKIPRQQYIAFSVVYERNSSHFKVIKEILYSGAICE